MSLLQQRRLSLPATRRLLRTTFGPYKVQGILGQGGMGTVYLARDDQGREVALKIVRESSGSAGVEASKRFKREAMISMEIVHRNVVRTYRAGVIDGTSFMATEFVRGGSLERFLTHHGKLPVPVALELFRDLLDALGAFEKANLVHRDVKPGNIFLELDGTSKLGDLGLARSTSVRRTKFTRTGVIIGSPFYMSPEQIEGEKTVDIRSDLYAAGVVLYQCLAADRPFKGETPYQVLKAHMAHPAPDVRATVPDVPAPVAELVASLLEKEREARPASAGEALERTVAILRDLSGGKLRSPDASLGSATSNTVVVPLSLLLAELPPIRPSPLIEPERASSEGLARACLAFATPTGEHKLFVYAGDKLVFGRVGLSAKAADVCLRILPAPENEAANLRISRTHLQVELQDERVLVSHVGGAGGTWLDHVPLVANTPVPLPSYGVLSVANVLELAARILPPPPPASMSITSTDPRASVVLERIANRSDHAYALVPGRLSLAAPPGRGVFWGATGDTQIANMGGTLWLAGGGLAPDTTVPLVDGLVFSVEGTPVHVTAIRPQDQE